MSSDVLSDLDDDHLAYHMQLCLQLPLTTYDQLRRAPVCFRVASDQLLLIDYDELNKDLNGEGGETGGESESDGEDDPGGHDGNGDARAPIT